ncbi:proline-rich protein 2-like [Epinephelus fuscoguttatus]|uniref:proline-rich protein 2-like n=1 Tax=Epinephelus fuscoguttatus TaxID=293821 RepID=UPI0020D0573E|nr:proline-rich protein 2-like [Epinephelus fuscoguttatus]
MPGQCRPGLKAGGMDKSQPDPGAARPPAPMDSGPGGPQRNPTGPHPTPPPKQLQRQAPATVPTWATLPAANRPAAEGRGAPPGCTDNEPHPAPPNPDAQEHRPTRNPASTPPDCPRPKAGPPAHPTCSPPPAAHRRAGPHCAAPEHPRGQHPAPTPGPPARGRTPGPPEAGREEPREHEETPPLPGTQGEQSRRNRPPGETARPRDPPQSQRAGPDSRGRRCI